MGDVTRRYLGEDVQSRALSPSGDHAAIATRDLLACVDRTGNELWRFEFGPVTGREGLSRSDCRYSLDGTVVWLYRPDDYAGRGDIDRWFALHAATGEVIGDAPLPTPGGETGEAGDDASDWAAAGLGELEEFTAYQAIDLQERRVIGPADADGSHTGRRPRFLPCSG